MFCFTYTVWISANASTKDRTWRLTIWVFHILSIDSQITWLVAHHSQICYFSITSFALSLLFKIVIHQDPIFANHRVIIPTKLRSSVWTLTHELVVHRNTIVFTIELWITYFDIRIVLALPYGLNNVWKFIEKVVVARLHVILPQDRDW